MNRTLNVIGDPFVAERRLPEQVVVTVGRSNHILQLANRIFPQHGHSVARPVADRTQLNATCTYTVNQRSNGTFYRAIPT